MNRLTILFTALAIGIMAHAQTQQKLAFVTKSNVNMRATPSAQGKVVGKAGEGMVFIAEQAQNGWRQVKDPTGKTAYISAAMLDNLRPEELNIYKATDILMTQEEADDEATTGYTAEKKFSNGVTVETWKFIGDKTGRSNKVKAVYTAMTAYDTGRMRTIENHYAGTANGWYILLTENTDYEGNVQDKRAEPIVVYPAFSANKGVFVDSVYFPDMSDSDNWD